MRTKEIKVVSREEAIEKVVYYCKSSKKPNVIPSTGNMCFGLAGLVMIDSDKEKPTDVVYFPILDHTPEMVAVPVIDRLDVIGFMDSYGDNNCFLDINNMESTCYLSNPLKGTVCPIPFSLMDTYSSMVVISNKLRGNNDSFYRSVIVDISSKVHGRSEPAVETVMPNKNKKGFSLLEPNKYREVLVNDRLDFVKFFDDNKDQKILRLVDNDFLVIVSVTSFSYVKVNPILKKRSRSVNIIIESIDDSWKYQDNSLRF